MKLKFLFLSIFFLLFCFSNSNSVTFADSAPSWCRITKESTYLYKDAYLSEPMFLLPTTYFLSILSYDENAFKVKFCDAIGYVKKDDVTVVYSQPLMPFPEDITCQINNSAYAVIKDLPSTSGNTIESIPSGVKVMFIGKTNGEEAILNLGNEWFYIKYYCNNQNYFGYIYAPLTENLTEIPQNNEEVLLTPVIAKEQNFSLSPELHDGKNILIIICLLIAGTILLLSIVLPIKHKRKPRRIVVPPKSDDLQF